MQQKLYREELLQIFPQKLRQRIEESVTFKNLTEIRLRADLPVLIETTQENYFLKKEEAAEKRRAIAKEEDNWILSPEQLKLIFEKISQYSVFAYTEEIGEGFITLKGGHRAGLCGKYYYRGEEKPQIKHISSINLRVAREVIGCAECIVPKLFEGNTFCHTLLISPPGCGKTTYLRDIIRLLSDGTDTITGKNVAVVDERSEIGNRTREGIGFYLGNRTDLMDHCPKAAGMLMMLRTMTPEILAADEIGGEKDIKAMAYVRNCGCRLLMTVHGNSMQDIFARPVLGEYLKKYPFERYVFLSKKEDREINNKKQIIYTYKSKRAAEKVRKIKNQRKGRKNFMVKILGGSLVLIAAYLFGMKLMEPAAEHIRLLEEGDLLYRILESEIRNTRTPLPILFGELSDRTNTRWHNFFLSFLSH